MAGAAVGQGAIAQIRQMRNGISRLGTVSKAVMGQNDVHAAAGSAILSAAHRAGARRLATGALYGAGINSAYGAFNNMSAGGSPFDGLLGNAMRGGLYGAGAGYAMGGLHNLGGMRMAGRATRLPGWK